MRCLDFGDAPLASVFFLAVALVALSFYVLISQGKTNWAIGAIGSLLFICVAFAAILYAVHYRNTLHKFREMDSPHVIFCADATSFTVSSLIGTTTLRWSAVKELWQFPTFWLLLYSKAQFSTLPLNCISPEMQAYILNRIREAGGVAS